MAVPNIDGKFQLKNALNKVCIFSLNKNSYILELKYSQRNIFKVPMSDHIKILHTNPNLALNITLMLKIRWISLTVRKKCKNFIWEVL